MKAKSKSWRKEGNKPKYRTILHSYWRYPYIRKKNGARMLEVLKFFPIQKAMTYMNYVTQVMCWSADLWQMCSYLSTEWMKKMNTWKIPYYLLLIFLMDLKLCFRRVQFFNAISSENIPVCNFSWVNEKFCRVMRETLFHTSPLASGW